MDRYTKLKEKLLNQWQRKLFAILAAVIVWFIVDHSITATKTIPSVPIRVINLPPQQTISGLLPNGFLSKRLTLTLTGTRDVVERLEPGDIEILVDVANHPTESVIQISKKDLVSLNPNINLAKHLNSVTHPEFILKLSPLVTESITVRVRTASLLFFPKYKFLDIWPVHLQQTVTGPQEQVLALKNSGLDLLLPVQEISQEELDEWHQAIGTDEFSFPVPDKWKKVKIPLLGGDVPLNDPKAGYLSLTFLKEEPLAIQKPLPIHLFYPLSTSAQFNAKNTPLILSNEVSLEMGNYQLNAPLFAQGVSRLFLDIVGSYMEIQVVVKGSDHQGSLPWSVGIIDAHHLQDIFVSSMVERYLKKIGDNTFQRNELVNRYKKRFRRYAHNMALYSAPFVELKLESRVEPNGVHLRLVR